MRFISIILAALLCATCGSMAFAADTIIGDLTAYPAGSYLAYLAPFDRSKTNGVDHAQTAIVQPGVFPAQTKFVWDWPARGTGVYTFDAVDFGDYLYTAVPTPIHSQKLMNVTTLTETHNLTMTGATTGFDAIIDFFTTTAPGSSSPRAHEIEVFLHTPAYSVWYVQHGTAIGTYIDANGLAWTVTTDLTTTPHDILIMPADGRDVLAGTIDLKAMLTWLIGTKWVGGGEYFNGLALGAEVQQGVGAMTVNLFSVNYK